MPSREGAWANGHFRGYARVQRLRRDSSARAHRVGGEGGRVQNLRAVGVWHKALVVGSVGLWRRLLRAVGGGGGGAHEGPPSRRPHFGTAPSAGSTTLRAGAWHFAPLRRGGGGGGEEVASAP